MNGTALAKHIAYVARWKVGGKRTHKLTMPCCGESLEVPAPDKPGGKQWDSLMTCPHCGELFIKIVTYAGAEARAINWEEAAP